MTRAELLDYAVKLNDRSVQVLVRNIVQTRQAGYQALTSVKNVMACIESSPDMEEVPNLVHFATDYERTHERLTGLFLTLAQTLQSQGHKIDF